MSIEMQIIPCKVCGKPYRVYAFYAGDQTACSDCQNMAQFNEQVGRVPEHVQKYKSIPYVCPQESNDLRLKKYFGERMQSVPKNKVILKNWSMYSNTSFYSAPEDRRMRLNGNAYGDPRRSAEGNYIRTSPIEKIADDLSWAETENTHYVLENMNEDYREWLENYRKNGDTGQIVSE